MDMRGFRTSVRIIQCKKFLNKLYASYFLYPRYTLYNILPGFTHITGIVSWRIFGNDSPIKPLLNNRMLICEIYSRRLNQDKIILFSQTSFDPTERPPKIDRVHKLHHWVAFLQCLQKEPKVKKRWKFSVDQTLPALYWVLKLVTSEDGRDRSWWASLLHTLFIRACASSRLPSADSSPIVSITCAAPKIRKWRQERRKWRRPYSTLITFHAFILPTLDAPALKKCADESVSCK